MTTKLLSIKNLMNRLLSRYAGTTQEQNPGAEAAADASGGKREQYADDAPIASSADDRFSRWPFAERIAHVLADRTDPASIVIGIYGPWGDGKTSVLNMMKEALSANQDVIVIPFNPWHFESEARLIRAFFDTLADGLGRTLATKREQVGETLKTYGHLLGLAGLGVWPRWVNNFQVSKWTR